MTMWKRMGVTGPGMMTWLCVRMWLGGACKGLYTDLKHPEVSDWVFSFSVKVNKMRLWKDAVLTLEKAFLTTWPTVIGRCNLNSVAEKTLKLMLINSADHLLWLPCLAGVPPNQLPPPPPLPRTKSLTPIARQWISCFREVESEVGRTSWWHQWF